MPIPMPAVMRPTIRSGTPLEAAWRLGIVSRSSGTKAQGLHGSNNPYEGGNLDPASPRYTIGNEE